MVRLLLVWLVNIGGPVRQNKLLSGSNIADCIRRNTWASTGIEHCVREPGCVKVHF